MNNIQASPFHQGEQQIQTQLGVRERMEKFGQKVIRNHLPEQHQDFYRNLQYLLVGHADKQGWPWASILVGDTGFIQSPDEGHLHIHAQAVNGDPLKDATKAGTHLGLLGIDLNTRRRNRLAGHIAHADTDGISLNVDQTFGNCPKFIQQREIHFQARNSSEATKETFTQLDSDTQAFIANADTFFVASTVADHSGDPAQGADISHRGGLPGFIRVDNDTTFTIPDYSGNFHFNTFGNFIENPKAGLLLIDFERGHLLMLSGTVEILWNSPELDQFENAERLWTFTINHGHWLKNALPINWQLHEYSPFLAKKAHR